MRKLLKGFVPIVLVALMIFTMGVDSIGQDSFIPENDTKQEEVKVEEPKIEEPKVEEPKIEEPKVEEPKVEEPKPEEPKVEEPKAEEPGEGTELPKEGDDIEEENQEVNEKADSDEDLVDKDDESMTLPEQEKLEYKIKYFIDSVEDKELETQLEVPIDNPIVEEISYENKPEGYILDEGMSTDLPFLVTKEDNIIEVYYMMGMSLLAIGGLQTNYNATTEVFKLETLTWSTNTHTRVFYAWYDGPNLYLAIGSHNGGEVIDVNYNGSTTNSAVDIHFGNENQKYININNQPYYLYDNNYPQNPAKIWNVVNLGQQTLASTFTLGVKTSLGGGHHVIFEMKINSSLQVYHDYEGDVVFDTDQSGNLKTDFSYGVHPIYTHNGEDYELINIKVEHNGVSQPDKGVEDLSGGNLNGVVGGTLTDRSAKITFIYRKVQKGKITITKTVENPKDPNQEFDIFVNGPNGSKYVVTLKNGQSKTIENLDLGNYTISEIVPMNYKLVGISNPSITLTRNNLEASSTVTNKDDNDGWFYDDDTRKNTFSGIVVDPGSKSQQSPQTDPPKVLEETTAPEEIKDPEEVLENNA